MEPISDVDAEAIWMLYMGYYSDALNSVTLARKYKNTIAFREAYASYKVTHFIFQYLLPKRQELLAEDMQKSLSKEIDETEQEIF